MITFIKRSSIITLAALGALWTSSTSAHAAATAPLISDQQPGTPRSDFFGFVGIKFTVGAQPLTVTELGRFFLDGNSGDHTVKLAKAADGVDVPGASTTVSMAGGVLGTYSYAALAAPVVLSANTSYYLVSQEAGSTDDWTDLNTTVTSAGIASVDGAVFIGSGFNWTVARTGNFAFGPVNLKYSLGPTVELVSPADASSVPAGRDVTLQAAASDFSGNIISVEFFDGATSLGVITSAPYSLVWSNAPAGAHALTAIVTDDQSQSATSPVSSLKVIACDVAVSFVTSFTSGSPRNNFTGPVGMKITIGAEPVLVTDLGRMFVSGNSRWHQVRLVRVSDETDVTNGAVMLHMEGGVEGEFTYGTLPAPVALDANTAYYLVSMEEAGGDTWLEHDSTVTVAPIATVEGGAFRTYEWATIPNANHSFVPVSFKYAPCGVTNAPEPTPEPPANTPPTVALDSPANNSTLTAPALISLEATALDNDGTISKVEFFSGETKLGEDDTIPYQYSWSNVPAGSYLLTARALDNSGATTVSSVINVTVNAAPEPEPTPEPPPQPAPQPPPQLPPGMGQIAVTVTGDGKVSPNFNGQLLKLGKRYTISATPNKGIVFSNWTGSLPSDSAKLTFVMRDGLVLQANFVINPFETTQGTYEGLFYPAEGISVVDSGLVSINVNSRGAYSGYVILEGGRVSFRGQMNLSGHATLQITRKRATTLTLDLQLDLTGGDEITGTISNGQWTSTIGADRAPFHARYNPATNFVGNYTVVLNNRGDQEPAVSMGFGHGTLGVPASGLLSISGTLPDGTRFSQRVNISKTGQWPLHVALYRNAGLLTAWMALNNPEAGSVFGTANWIHPAQPKARTYREAFTNVVDITGVRYQAPTTKTNSLITLPQGVVIFSGGDLIAPIVQEITVGPGSRVTNLSTNKMSLSFSPKNGTFSGSVAVPGFRKPISFEGAVLQNQNAGWGFMSGTNHAAKVFVGMP